MDTRNEEQAEREMGNQNLICVEITDTAIGRFINRILIKESVNTTPDRPCTVLTNLTKIK